MLGSCAGPGKTAQNEQASAALAKDLNRPKLIVGIVVDQMRYDFLYRYWSKYGNGGFRKLVREGYNFTNTQYSYVPTYTAPGHASIYTGSTPSLNGIIGNSWYNRNNGKTMYCVEDKSVSTVGSTSSAGLMSPKNLLTTTITDELRLATNKGSKVIGIALKDRGAVLPAGHLANAAYWFDSPSGNWITSTYYMNELPQWVQEFNNKKYPDQYLSQVWNTLLPIAEYTESSADDVPWEEMLDGETSPVFPHNIPAIRQKDYELLRSLPAGNTLTKDFALAALKSENLGKGNFTDFLAVSFSSTDYVGHSFGPNAVETQDIYLRLDKEIEQLITEVEKTVGKENVLFFLTADHGGAHVPSFLQSNKVPAGVARSNALRDTVENYLNETYGAGKWVEKYTNQQLYLNRKLIDSKKLNRAEVQQKVANYIMGMEGVARVVAAENLLTTSWTEGLMARVESGYNIQRSGDVIVVLQPAWFAGWQDNQTRGTSHGSYSNYDTHVPLIWYGWNIKPGESAAEVKVTDIAPTIATWLYIQEPNGSIGKPLQELMK